MRNVSIIKVAIFTGAVAIASIGWVAGRVVGPEAQSTIGARSSSGGGLLGSDREQPMQVPSGVSLGSWLSLEDYFFSGARRVVWRVVREREEGGGGWSPTPRPATEE